MIEKRIIVFGGTTEGRNISEQLLDLGYKVTVCVATDYGEHVLEKCPGMTVCVDRLSKEAMQELFEKEMAFYIVDATHPYAKEVSKNIKQACEASKKPYLRVLRESVSVNGADYFDSLEDVASYLNGVTGNVLVTTGSKELKPFCRIPDYTSRVFVRVLPTVESIESCNQNGFYGKQILAMQGPFSETFNRASIREIHAEYMVTKDSGKAGGLQDKIDAAEKENCRLLVIRRPKEENGCHPEEVAGILERASKKNGRTV